MLSKPDLYFILAKYLKAVRTSLNKEYFHFHFQDDKDSGLTLNQDQNLWNSSCPVENTRQNSSVKQ